MSTFAQRRVFEAGVTSFAERGFAATELPDVARRAGVSLAEAAACYPTREALALALYTRLADDLEEVVPTLPQGRVADRWAATMHAKLDLVAPHQRALRSLAGHALDPDGRIGVLGARSAVVRSRVSAVFRAVVDGATDAPTHGRAELARGLYGLHLTVILRWTQLVGDDDRPARELVEVLRAGLAAGTPLLSLPGAATALGRVDALFGELLRTSLGQDLDALANTLLDRIFARRRLAEPGPAPATDPAERALHLPRIRRALDAGEPLHLVLPAFPAKSPNPRKTLGPLPDLAEVLALENLQALCNELREAWPAGARITIASDGHVFADLVEVPDEHVTAYNEAIAGILAERGLSDLDLFGMADVMRSVDFDEARADIVAQHGIPLDAVRARAAEHPHHRRMVDGIHRFLTEDAAGLHPDWSKNRCRSSTRERAYEVVQRSDAWGRLVATCFPDALRLSIHPQPRVSEKIGVHLIDTDDVWLTPWHGVAWIGRDGARLVQRHQAEAAGAVRVGEGGMAHFADPP